MLSDQEKSSSDLKRPDTSANKRHAEMRIVENDGVSRLVAWGGAFAFACLLIASTFKRSKKIRTSKRSRDDDSDLKADGFGESSGCSDDARPMEGLQLLLQSSSTDLINRSCHTRSKMLVKYASIEDSNFDENQTPTMQPILEKNEDEKIVVIIYEDEYPDSDKSVENEAHKYDESSKVAESSSFRSFNEATWLAEWTDKSSISSSSSLSSSSSSEETSSQGILLEKEGDDNIIDIDIYIDDDDEKGEDEEARIV